MQFPECQKTALHSGRALHKQGKAGEALLEYEAAVTLEPHGTWAPVALFYGSTAAAEDGKATKSGEYATKLRSQHPTSPYVVRLDLEESELQGDGRQAALRRQLDLEIEAAQELESARTLAANDTPRAIEKLSELALSYKDCVVAGQISESKGHLLIRENRDLEALAEFGALCEQYGSEYPESRIYQVAKTRCAALYHRIGNRESALDTYLDIIDASSSDKAITANAIVQAIGVYFEIIQHGIFSDELDPTEKEWDRLHDLCALAREFGTLTEHQMSRVDLMQLEAHSWQENWELVEEAFLRFSAEYDESTNKVEVATATFFYAQMLRETGRAKESIEHWDKVISFFPESSGKNEIWENMDHLPRTYFEKYMALFESGASSNEVVSAYEALIHRFPNSFYSRLAMKDSGYIQAISDNEWKARIIEAKKQKEAAKQNENPK